MNISIKTIIVLILLACSINVFSQKNYNVLNWNASTILNTWLVQQTTQEYNQRDARLNQALSSEKTMLAYRDDCRNKYKQLLGKMPDAGNLHDQLKGIIQQDGYRIEKIIFESFPKHHVTANIYIPSGKGLFPAALFLCGHEVESKATESYQKTAILFAKNGFVVMLIDPISQGERFQLTDSNGVPSTRGGTAEHILLNVGCNLVGTSVAAYELWDNIRSLDYLTTRPEVDAKRIGCLGNSGGGTQTGYMMSYDDRIKVSAPCSYVLNNNQTLEMKGPPDGCVPIIGEAKQQLEDADYFIMFAPKPILILAGKYDFINYNRVTNVYKEVKKVYSTLNHKESIRLLTVDDGHGITKPKREAAVTWFKKWLCNDSTPIKEQEIKTLSTKELNCTITGQANSDYKEEETIALHNIMLANKLSATRKVLAEVTNAKCLTEIKKIAGITINTSPIEKEWMGEIVKNNYTIKKLILRRAGEIPLPCLMISSNNKIKNGKIALCLAEEGKNKLADSISLINQYMMNYDVLILADLRGLGEETEHLAINDSKYYNPAYRNANMALSLHKSLTGQRTEDIFTLTDYIKESDSLKSMHLEAFATGVNAPALIHAALLDKRIDHITLSNTIPTYYSLLQTPLTLDRFEYVIPNVLSFYDLPDLISMIGKERVNYLQ